jgi:ABC-type nitrate/sulfonate/bicarbonate transport system substrate-binding protein
MPQRDVLREHMSALENTALPLRLAGARRGRATALSRQPRTRAGRMGTRPLPCACLAAARLAAVCVAVGAPLSACGAKQEVVSSPQPRPFRVLLDAPPGPEQASLYTALANGDFRAAGLEVSVTAPRGAAEALAQLAAGSAEMALGSEPQVLSERDRGVPVVSIAALGTKPALAGAPAYEDPVLVVRVAEAEHDGEALRAFLHALARGARAARSDPAAAARLVLGAARAHAAQPQPARGAGRGRTRRNGAGGARSAEAAALRDTVAAVQQALQAGGPPGPGLPQGYQSPAAWEAYGRWMYVRGMLRTDPAARAPAFTNEFLPGQGI